MTTVEDKKPEYGPNLDFFLNQLMGSSAAIRLINSTCEWIKEIAGKTNFIFLGCELDTNALSKNWLKPLDNHIYIVKGITDVLALREKCWTSVSRSDVGSILRATQHVFKTLSDALSGIRCIAMFGSVVLFPYTNTLGLWKNGFAIGSGCFEIACRVHHIVAATPTGKEKSQKDKNLAYLGDVAMIILQVFSIQLNLFGGYYAAFKDVIPKSKQMPSFVFNFWGTCASLAALAYSGVEYARRK